MKASKGSLASGEHFRRYVAPVQRFVDTRQPSQGVGRELFAGAATEAGLDRQHQPDRLPHQAEATAQQVARGALLARVDVAFR